MSGKWLVGMWLLVLPAVKPASAAVSVEGWTAGAASIDITPSYPVRLSGYGSRTAEHEGVAIPIHTKALALSWRGDTPALIITVDNVGVPGSLREAVLKRLTEAGWKIPNERLALHSSHTHCAPMLNGVLPFLFGQALTKDEQEHVDRYTADLTAWITEAATTALKKMVPAKAEWGTGRTMFAFNRRTKTETGFINEQNFKGPVDYAVPVLQVTTPDNVKLALLTSYACHCTVLSINKIHGDWAGCAQRDLEMRFPGVVAMTAIGCGGDQNPYPRRKEEYAVLHGATLAREVVRVINRPMKPVRGPVTCALREVMLPFEPLPAKEDLEARAAGSNKWQAMHARHFLGLLQQGEKAPPALAYPLQVWSFGSDLLSINLAGEVVVDYSLRFKREFDPARTWVNAYTNDVPCYIPSQRVWEEGGYEGGGAMIYYGRPNRFASGVEEIIARTLREIVPAEYLHKTR